MRVESIKLEGFRSFGPRAEVEFTKNPTVLVGENNVGKSSLIAALVELLALNPGGRAQSNARFAEAGRLFVSTALSLEEGERRDLVAWLEPKADVNFDPAGRQNLEATLGTLFSRITAHARSGVLGAVGVGEFSLSSGAIRVGRGTTNYDLLDLIATHAGRPVSEMATANPLDGIETIRFSEDVRGKVTRFLGDRIRCFNDVRVRPKLDQADSTHFVHESLDGSDLAHLLFQLKNSAKAHRDRYALIQTAFSDFFPGLAFEVIGTEASKATIQFSVGANEFEVAQDKVGTGVVATLTLLANLEGRDGFVFVVEEPEQHLHPHAQRQLSRIISQSAERNQLIVLTHSPVFVDPDNLGGLVRIWQSPTGATATPFPADLSKRDEAAFVEAVRDGVAREALFARAVLIVEDQTQRGFIEAVAPRLGFDLNRNSISVVRVDGQDGYKPFLRALKGLRIPIRCIRDLKGGPKEDQKLFRPLGAEIEDVLEAAGLGDLMKEAAKAVGRNKTRVGRYVGARVRIEDVPSVFAEVLEEMVELSRTGW